MANVAAILEDADRITGMRAVLARLLPDVDPHFFEDAKKMISWLEVHATDVAFFSLDHDLPLRGEAGRTQDCGTGRQVADYLASELPTCPIIIHSSNAPCAEGMLRTLVDSGWPCSRVYPHDDTAWIEEAWLPEIRRLLTAGWIVLR